METEERRARRRRQRILFDDVADLYQECRLGYPDDVITFLAATAGLRAGSTVLDVGCGTGQLTRSLTGHGVELTGIDIAPSMIATARRHLTGPAVSFEVASFEDFDAAGRSFDLIVAGAAFHWIDPEVRFSKAARLLRPGGWLALLATDERYDDPFGAALTGMWIALSDDGGAWARDPKLTDAELITQAGLFGQPAGQTHDERMTLPAGRVIGMENTRASALSWPAEVRQHFTAELHGHLQGQTEVHLTWHTTLTMAQRQGSGRETARQPSSGQ